MKHYLILKRNEGFKYNFFFCIQFNTLEKVIIKLAQDLYNKTKNDKSLYCYSGVGLNSVANKKILDKTKFKNILNFNALSSGIPFGLALWGYYNLKELNIKQHKKLIFKNA